MPQVARPSSDIAAGSWWPTPVFEQIGEYIPDDATFVQTCPRPEGGGAFIVGLSVVQPPLPGDQTLTVRMRQTREDIPVCVRVSLLQDGDTVVAARSFGPLTEEFLNYPIALSGCEIASIRHYAALSLRVEAAEADCGGSFAVRGVESRLLADKSSTDFPSTSQSSTSGTSSGSDFSSTSSQPCF